MNISQEIYLPLSCDQNLYSLQALLGWHLVSNQTCMLRKIAIRIDPKENSVNTPSVLKLLFSPQFPGKDVEFYIEALQPRESTLT